MEASRAGKAIFCEKPISLNLEIIDEVCQVNNKGNETDDRWRVRAACLPCNDHGPAIPQPISINPPLHARYLYAIQVVEETGALCMVAFQRRFDPTFRRLKQAVEKGEIGDVHMIHITSRDPGPPPVAYIAQVRVCLCGH